MVAGADWDRVSESRWELGKDGWRKWPKRSTRYLFEVKLIHVATRRGVRFYTTHLSHGDDQSGQRVEQIAKLLKIVRERARPGELPPIVVGDFNRLPTSRIGQMMDEHFALAHNSNYDQIWIGRKRTFIGARGNLVPIAVSIVELEPSGLSDHNAPRATVAVDSFAAMSAEYVVRITTSDIEKAGTDARVFLTLTGTLGSTQECRLDNPTRDDFERATTSEFAITSTDLGVLSSIRLRHDNSGTRPGWHVKEVRVRARTSAVEALFSCNRWLATSHGGTDFTFPAT